MGLKAAKTYCEWGEKKTRKVNSCRWNAYPPLQNFLFDSLMSFIQSISKKGRESSDLENLPWPSITFKVRGKQARPMIK